MGKKPQSAASLFGVRRVKLGAQAYNVYELTTKHLRMSPEDAIKRLEAIDGFGQVEAVNDKKDVVRFRWEGDVNTLHIIRHVLVEEFVLQLRLPGDPE